MNYREHLCGAVVDSVGGFADLTGDFNARDITAPIINDRLSTMSDKEILGVLTEPHRNVEFASEVLEEIGLSLVI